MKYWESIILDSSMHIIFRALQESGISQNLPLFIRKFKIQTFFRFQKKQKQKYDTQGYTEKPQRSASIHTKNQDTQDTHAN